MTKMAQVAVTIWTGDRVPVDPPVAGPTPCRQLDWRQLPVAIWTGDSYLPPFQLAIGSWNPKLVSRFVIFVDFQW